MDKLDFQDLPYDDGGSTSSKPKEHVIEFSEFPPDATEPLEDEQETEPKQETKHSIFSIGFYQQFFDVDTFDVGSRMLGSMVPNPRRNYLEHSIRPKPDLYGPFWICATLTFCIGITGNVADFFAKSGADFKWKYDFHKVPLAATVIFSYWLVIPLIIWGILRWRGSKAGFLLTEIICIYGYSLTIFIPVSILWIIQVTWVQILLAVLSGLLSGATLLITLYPAVKNDSKQVMAIFLLIVVVLHALLATGFVLFFFKYDRSVVTIKPTETSPAATTTAKLSSSPPGVDNQQDQSPDNKTKPVTREVKNNFKPDKPTEESTKPAEETVKQPVSRNTAQSSQKSEIISPDHVKTNESLV